MYVYTRCIFKIDRYTADTYHPKYNIEYVYDLKESTSNDGLGHESMMTAGNIIREVVANSTPEKG